MRRSPIGLRAEEVFTSASWRRPQVASVCPTSGSLEVTEFASVDVTEAILGSLW